jgi:hypothetical protein
MVSFATAQYDWMLCHDSDYLAPYGGECFGGGSDWTCFEYISFPPTVNPGQTVTGYIKWSWTHPGNPYVYLSFFGDWAPNSGITIYNGTIPGSNNRTDDFTFTAPSAVGSYRIRIAYISSSSPVPSFWGSNSSTNAHAFSELPLKVEDHECPPSVDESPSQQPAGYELNQNYPNPFNPRTTINYSVQSPGIVKINIYNSVGQVVRTLTEEYHVLGDYSCTWDGADEHGSKVASGVYYYQMEVGEYHSAKQMILLK